MTHFQINEMDQLEKKNIIVTTETRVANSRTSPSNSQILIQNIQNQMSTTYQLLSLPHKTQLYHLSRGFTINCRVVTDDLKMGASKFRSYSFLIRFITRKFR